MHIELILLDVLREVIEGRPDIKAKVYQVLRDRKAKVIKLSDYRKDECNA